MYKNKIMKTEKLLEFMEFFRTATTHLVIGLKKVWTPTCFTGVSVQAPQHSLHHTMHYTVVSLLGSLRTIKPVHGGHGASLLPSVEHSQR